MDQQNNNQPQERQETAEQKRLRYMTDEERREWSGISEWQDPLEKEHPQQNENEGKLALASVLCGIAALLTVCTGYANAILGIAAIVCGIISKTRQEGKGHLSTAGIVLGIIGLSVALVMLVIWALKILLAPGITGNLPAIPA
ncbi:MAG: hypothetical protein IKQ91_06035 [Oscillospiraceae bacterium]|nr:hypothetical protein [Oscillospiraceae bacterium]